MTEKEQKIISEIKAHAAIINNLVKKLDTPQITEPLRKGKHTPEQIADIKAKFKKSMYTKR